MLNFAPPHNLIIDKGTEFLLIEHANCCTLFNFRDFARSSHAPSINGLAKVQNKNLATHLRLLLLDTPEKWPIQVTFFAHAHNTQALSLLLVSPHEINFHM